MVIPPSCSWEPWEALPSGLLYVSYGREASASTGAVRFRVFAYASIAQRETWWRKVFPKGSVVEGVHGLFRSLVDESTRGKHFTTLGAAPMSAGKRRGEDAMIIVGKRRGEDAMIVAGKRAREEDEEAELAALKERVERLEKRVEAQGKLILRMLEEIGDA